MSGEPLDLDELVEHWTLLDGDRDLVADKRGSARPAFAVMVKFYARHGRFPDGGGDSVKGSHRTGYDHRQRRYAATLERWRNHPRGWTDHVAPHWRLQGVPAWAQPAPREPGSSQPAPLQL